MGNNNDYYFPFLMNFERLIKYIIRFDNDIYYFENAFYISRINI